MMMMYSNFSFYSLWREKIGQSLDHISSSTQLPSVQRLLWKIVSQHIIANNAEFASALFDEAKDITIAHTPPPASEESQASMSTSVTASVSGSENESENERESAKEGGGGIDSTRARIYKEFVSGALMSAIARANPDAIMVTRLLVLYRIHHKLHMSRNGSSQVRRWQHRPSTSTMAFFLFVKKHTHTYIVLLLLPFYTDWKGH